MAPDGASAEFAIEEERDLFEMANLYPRTTGMPVAIWVSPRGGARHDVRVRVSPGPGDWMDLEDAAVVGVRPAPALLQGELAADVREPVFAWVAANRDVLVACWSGELDTIELGARLRRYSAG